MINVFGLRGFLPGSHLVGSVPTEEMVGQSMQFKFLDVDRDKKRIVVSNRRAMQEQSSRERGDLVQGKVTALKPYGAFVVLDSDGLPALLHVKNISRNHVADIEAVLPIGS